jgi:hypothetical protein
MEQEGQDCTTEVDAELGTGGRERAHATLIERWYSAADTLQRLLRGMGPMYSGLHDRTCHTDMAIKKRG